MGSERPVGIPLVGVAPRHCAHCGFPAVMHTGGEGPIGSRSIPGHSHRRTPLLPPRMGWPPARIHRGSLRGQVQRGPVGRPPTRPDAIAGDKAYSTRANRACLRRRRIRAVIPVWSTASPASSLAASSSPGRQQGVGPGMPAVTNRRRSAGTRRRPRRGSPIARCAMRATSVAPARGRCHGSPLRNRPPYIVKTRDMYGSRGRPVHVSNAPDSQSATAFRSCATVDGDPGEDQPGKRTDSSTRAVSACPV